MSQLPSPQIDSQDCPSHQCILLLRNGRCELELDRLMDHLWGTCLMRNDRPLLNETSIFALHHLYRESPNLTFMIVAICMALGCPPPWLDIQMEEDTQLILFRLLAFDHDNQPHLSCLCFKVAYYLLTRVSFLEDNGRNCLR